MAGMITKLDAGSTVAHGRSDYIAVHGHRGTTNINVIAMVGMMVDIQMYLRTILFQSVVSQNDIHSSSDIILKVKPPTIDEISQINSLYPGCNEEFKNKLVSQKCGAFTLDCVPRIS